jgi:outer membrane protein OmpA-like peptidoglycan-associated protein
MVTPVAAQDAGKPTPGAALQYVGANTRLGLGYDSETKLRGELFQVLRADDTSATLAEIWASNHVGGVKLSQHWSAGSAAVNKVFIAADQGDNDMRKATIGGGQEYEKWFWNAYVSKGLSGARLTSTAAIANTITQSGTDGGRQYVEDVTTTVTTRAYQRPYDWGVGARAGHFYEAALVRVTAGLDYEWGKFSSQQWTGTLMAEKFFAGSPISIALTGEINRRNGDFEGKRNDQRGFVMLRYELGAPASSFRPSKITRSVTSTERVPDPDWRPVATISATPSEAPAASAAPVAVATPTAATSRIEQRAVRAQNNDAQETYFDLGSSRLKPAAARELDAVVARINAQQPYVELKVNIIGHTCPTGSDRNNFALSTKRAEVVKAYLIGKGVPVSVITSSAVAGRSPKYPEVKGQSFRNRRADTEVLVVKEKIEDVRINVPGVAAPATVAAPPAPAPAPVAAATVAAVAPMIDRQVTREVIENVPNNWMSRALHNPSQHKTTVDSYRWVETSSAQNVGPRRFLNRGPAAVNDAFTVDCTAPITFNVLANDTDPDGDALSITSVTTPGKGTAVISSGKIVYTPSATSCGGGTDSFTYTISDGRGGTSTATVAVTINNTVPVVPPPTNNAPVAVNDLIIVPCKATAVLDVLANDSDKDGDPLTITSVTQPSKSSIAIGANGKTLIYTPGAACFTNDTFTYTISDGKGGTSTATVTLVDP